MSTSFDGPCPFLTCPETGSHQHVGCATCGEVRCHNLSCPDCVAVMNAELAAEGIEPLPNIFGRGDRG